MKKSKNIKLQKNHADIKKFIENRPTKININFNLFKKKYKILVYIKINLSCTVQNYLKYFVIVNLN